MEFRIKDLTIQSYRSFEGSWTQFEKQDAQNNAKIKRLFQDLQNGKNNGFYLVSDREFKLYHKSTKEAGAIQYSYGFYKNGELIPCGDIQMHDFSDLLREGYPAGVYRTIA